MDIELALARLPDNPSPADYPKIPGLTYRRNGAGTVYWMYRKPGSGRGGKAESLGRDWEFAAGYALEANRLANQEQDDAAVARAAALENLISAGADLEREVPFVVPLRQFEKLKRRAVSDSYADGLRIRCNQYTRWLGNHFTNHITTKQLADILKVEAPNAPSYAAHRTLLGEIFDFCLSEGYRDDSRGNPARTLTKTKLARPGYLKQRVRITPRQWFAVYALAPEWLQIAMDICLQTGLRRKDVCGLRFDNVHGDYLLVTPSKTDKSKRDPNTHPVRLVIRIDDQLRAVIERARKTADGCPFILHKDNRYHRGAPAEIREHYAQVLPQQLTRHFKEVRDKTGLFTHLTAKQRPTYHEGRSLCSWAYTQEGRSLEETQALLGHASPEMTEDYLKGHPNFKFAKSGLNVVELLRRPEFIDKAVETDEDLVAEVLRLHSALDAA